MSGLLASVTDAAEARLALAGGADIIDGKAPRRGALGALPPATLRAIVAAIDGAVPVSATIGDLPNDPRAIAAAALATAGCGVDFVKIGFLSGDGIADCLDALAPLAGDQPLIAVCFADRLAPEPLLHQAARCGFRGVMLDTADKRGGPLTRLLGPARLGRFVRTAQAEGLLCGLAGSLAADDVVPLMALGCDYLGFRGALCRGGRGGPLDPAALARIRTLLDGTLRPRQALP